MCTWGKTPGKWLFNITVTDQNGKKPGFTQALMRSLWIWFSGLAMGIPVISIISLAANFKLLVETKSLPFDRKNGLIVEHGYHSTFKNILIVIIYGVFISYQITITPVDQEYSPIFNEQINERTYSEDAEYLNESGCSLMDKGEYLQAKEEFLKGLEICKNLELRDTLLNNLSWACYCLEEYEEALDYSQEGLKLGDNSSIEYTNYANALCALGNISEGEKAYRTAIDIDKNNAYALHGLGVLKYNNYCYDEAIPLFEKYTSIKRIDPEGWCYLGLSHLYNSNNMAKAKECLDKAYKLSSNDIFVIRSLCNYYSYVGEYKEAENLYAKALEENPDSYDLICSVASFYRNEGKYDRSIEFADRAIDCNKENYIAYGIKAGALFDLGKTDEAIDTINAMLGNNSQNADAYYAAGNIYKNAYKYKEAIESYTKALDLNPVHEDAIIGKIISLYWSKRYTACLNFAMEYESKVDNYLIQWYIGDVYSILMNSEKAIEYYKKALNMKENDADLLVSIGWEYYYLEDFNNALAYADKALEINESHNGAGNLKASINKRKSSIVEQVSEFIEDNYMYYKSNDKYEAIKNSLKGKASVSVPDIEELFNSVRKDDDQFSFILTGDYYKYYIALQQENTVE